MSERLEAALRELNIDASDIHTTTMNMCKATLIFTDKKRVTMLAMSPLNFGAMSYGELCSLCLHIQAFGNHIGLYTEEFIVMRDVKIGPVACIPGSTSETLKDMRRDMSASVEGIGVRSQTLRKSDEVFIGYVGVTYTDLDPTRPATSYSDAKRKDVPVIVYLTDKSSSAISIKAAREDILYAQTQGAYDKNYLNKFLIYGATVRSYIWNKYLASTIWYRTLIWSLFYGNAAMRSRIMRSIPYVSVIYTHKHEDVKQIKP